MLELRCMEGDRDGQWLRRGHLGKILFTYHTLAHSELEKVPTDDLSCTSGCSRAAKEEILQCLGPPAALNAVRV